MIFIAEGIALPHILPKLEISEAFRHSERLLYIVSEFSEDQLKKCLDNPHRGVSFKANPDVNTHEAIDQLREKDIELFTWTVDEKEAIDYYYPLGVKNFVTNRILP